MAIAVRARIAVGFHRYGCEEGSAGRLRIQWGNNRGGWLCSFAYPRGGATLNADWGQRPDRIPGVPLYPPHQTTAEWFNPAAFEAPQFPGQAIQCCRWGNAARGSIRGPGMIGTDWALWREFRFKTPLNRENTLLQFAGRILTP